MEKKFLIFFVLIYVASFFGFSFCAEAIQKDTYYPYWQQRTSLFDVLPNTTNEIIFLGDSITDGCNWAEMFQDIRIKNRGISGDMTEGLLDRLDEVVESSPLQVFLMIGINDLAEGKSEDYVASNIKKIVLFIKRKSPETEVYLHSLLPVNEDFGMFHRYTSKTDEILAINGRLKKFCLKHKMTYIDLYSAVVSKGNKLNPEYTNDGLHLTGAGYLAWKSVIDKYIK